MKKTFRTFLLALASFLSAITLMSGGCDDRPSNVGYHYVELRHKNYLDLIRFLDDKDNAKVYNALCNLAFEANNMNICLMQDSFMGTPKRDTDLIIHRKVTALLSSKDPWIASAAIRFLGEVKYERKAYLDQILKDNRTDRNIQLEICKQLATEDPKDQLLLRNKILFLRNQKDWLLKNSAFGIVRSNDSCATDIFLDDYQHASDPETRSLAFYALLKRVDQLSFPILASEYDKTKDKETKDDIMAGLFTCSYHTLAEDWFFSQPGLLDSAMEDIITTVLDNSPGQAQREDYSPWVMHALRVGWRPSRTPVTGHKAVYPGEPLLYKELLYCKHNTPGKPDSITFTKAGRAVENAILADPVLRKEWLDYQKRMTSTLLPASLLLEHLALTQSYLARSRSLIFRQTGDTALARFFEQNLMDRTKEFNKTTLPWQHGRE